MGVINLGSLVEKLKKKLSGTFITTTDYATTSKAGIVKVGSNLTMNGTSHKLDVPIAASDTLGVVKVGSGLSIADGVLSASSSGSGITADKILTGPYGYANTKRSFTFPSGKTISDYKFLIIRFAQLNDGTSSATGVIPVAAIPTDTGSIPFNVSGIGVDGDMFVGSSIYKDGINTSYSGSITAYLMDVYAIG